MGVIIRSPFREADLLRMGTGTVPNGGMVTALAAKTVIGLGGLGGITEAFAPREGISMALRASTQASVSLVISVSVIRLIAGRRKLVPS